MQTHILKNDFKINFNFVLKAGSLCSYEDGDSVISVEQSDSKGRICSTPICYDYNGRNPFAARDAKEEFEKIKLS